MTVYTAAITLVLVLDPFGNIPLFLSVLSAAPPKRRVLIVVREMLIALGVLVVFLFFGKYILQGLHISEPALGIAAGVILFLIAIRMIFPAEAQLLGAGPQEEPLIVPLAVPLVAGPSSIATVTLLASRYPQRLLWWLAALLMAWAVCAGVLVSADLLGRLLGNRLLRAIERLMGLILTTLAVQMLLSGATEFLRSLEG